jgi:AcrR family transcriptional regulator
MAGGDQGLPRELPQSELIIAAFVDLIAERGYHDTTLSALLERVGFDQREFQRHFAGLDDCFAVLWEQSKDQVVLALSAAFLSADTWREGMRRAAWAFCRWLQENPGRARALLVDVAYAPDEVRAYRDSVINAYIELVHLGRHERPEAAHVPRASAEAVIGAIWERAGAEVNAGRFDRLPAQVPQMMYVMVAPYLGTEAAEEELRRGPEDIAAYEAG